MVEGASFGRNYDTMAGTASNISGALRGTAKIPEEWVRAVELANQPFFAEAEGDPDAARQRAALLEEMLGEQ